MAYITGSVNSYDELLNILTSACIAAGWSLQDGILVKGAALVRPYASVASYGKGAGLSLEGGSGRNGSILTGSSDKFRPRLGSPSLDFPEPNWPCVYHVFCHNSPDEVYAILRHDVDAYYWLSFGISDVPGIGGTGLWMIAISGLAKGTMIGGGVNMSETSGNPDVVNTYGSTSGPWWGTNQIPLSRSIGAILLEAWIGCGGISYGYVNAVEPLAPLVAHSHSSWNAESVLLPIRVHRGVAERKNLIVLEHRHARYLRIGNLEPEQVITIGVERWKVFPFYRKNTQSPNVVNRANHSGTFGWAIRYDGP